VIVIGYELFLVPRFLKEHNESALVTLYVPELWPSSELFRCLPRKSSHPTVIL
jgi:trehalose-6-phosphate synthase